MEEEKWLTSQAFTYIGSPNANLVCCICQMPFVEPTTTRTCTHTFCNTCIKHALSVSQYCPIDRSPLTLRDLQPASPIVRYMVDELTVECLHHRDGCTHTCQRQLLASHLKEACLFAHVPCPEADCDQQVLRRDITKHSSNCVHRLVPCEGCSIQVKLTDLESHNLVCAAKITTCGYCDAEYPRSEASTHEASCPDMTVNCTHATHGCPWTGTRRSLADSHIPACTYEAIKDFFIISDTRVAALTKENLLLKQRLEASEGLIHLMHRELQAVKNALGPWYQTEPQDGHARRYDAVVDQPPSIPSPPFSPPIDTGPESASSSPSQLPFRTLASYFPPIPVSAHPHPAPPPPSLPTALTSLHTSLDSLSVSHDSLARLTELSVGAQAAEITALRSVVNGLRMQVHTILMERSVGGGSGVGDMEEPGRLGMGMGMTSGLGGGWSPPHGRFPMYPPPGPGPYSGSMPSSSASVKL